MPSNRSRPPTPQSLSVLDTRNLSRSAILSLFQHADELGERFHKTGSFIEPGFAFEKCKVIACLFFEASTRTFLSFQTAAFRLGHQVIGIDIGTGTSIVKGETEEDTVLNVAAMQPDAIVIRYNFSEGLDRLLPTLPMPVISAGSGTLAHPTQALLDAYTIYQERGKLEGEKILLVGDINHSRVARSNFDVLTKLGAEVAVAGPEYFMPAPSEIPGIKIHHELDSVLQWPTVIMGLRVQLERHKDPALRNYSIDDYRELYHGQFGLNLERLKKLRNDVLIMHPGPINHGVEFAPEVMSDPRSRVLKQVTNGVLIRAALLSKILSGRLSSS